MSIYAVNGKEPIAAWIPSLDTAGNGTTTLTDLVGSNHGTLTNMDAATDWVADTGAGGVRALDFDGVNDFVVIAANAAFEFSTNIDFSVSIWANLGTTADVRELISYRSSNTRWQLRANANKSITTVVFDGTNVASISGPITSGWIQAVLVCDRDTDVKLYINGVLAATQTIAISVNMSVNGSIRISSDPVLGSRHYLGLADDIRIFNQVLNDADVSALYAGGNGRGITFGGTIQTRRRRDLGGFGL